MRLVDLSYLKHNMTSIEEIEVENYRNILTFVDNLDMENYTVNLDFLGLPQMEIGNNEGHFNFSIGKETVCLIAYTQDDLKYYGEYFANKDEIHGKEVLEFLNEIEPPCVITPIPLSIKQKEAAYHIFMALKK